MSIVKALILRVPGTNCDMETAYAFEQAGAISISAHINELITQSHKLSDYQILVFPGGFGYGDDLGAGKVLSNEIKLKLKEDVDAFIGKGGLILGICNGFQALTKSGILPNPKGSGEQLVTLSENDSGRFECRWVNLKANQESNCVFTKGIEKMYLPVAHGEGKLIVPPEVLPSINATLYYADDNGLPTDKYPDNPNGSVDNIAGICDDSGRIFALMPHPERYIMASQHPLWTRRNGSGWGDGFKIFMNAVDWVNSL